MGRGFNNLLYKPQAPSLPVINSLQEIYQLDFNTLPAQDQYQLATIMLTKLNIEVNEETISQAIDLLKNNYSRQNVLNYPLSLLSVPKADCIGDSFLQAVSEVTPELRDTILDTVQPEQRGIIWSLIIKNQTQEIKQHLNNRSLDLEHMLTPFDPRQVWKRQTLHYLTSPSSKETCCNLEKLNMKHGKITDFHNLNTQLSSENKSNKKICQTCWRAYCQEKDPSYQYGREIVAKSRFNIYKIIEFLKNKPISNLQLNSEEAYLDYSLQALIPYLTRKEISTYGQWSYLRSYSLLDRGLKPRLEGEHFKSYFKEVTELHLAGDLTVSALRVAQDNLLKLAQS